MIEGEISQVSLSLDYSYSSDKTGEACSFA